MNISKYMDFYLVEKISSKTQKPYHAICIRINETDIPICFIGRDKYELLKTYIASN